MIKSLGKSSVLRAQRRYFSTAQAEMNESEKQLLNSLSLAV